MLFPALTLTLFLMTPIPDGEAPVLEWKEPEAQAEFDKAKEQFEAGKFKDSAKAFSSLKKQAKNKAAKTEIARYRRACEGGIKLAVYKKKAKGKRKYKTYLDADKSFPKYQDTPIEREYKLFLLGLKKELFTVVENFDRSSSRYSEDKGKKFIDDPKIVKQGKQCLEWEVAGENISLKVKGSKLPDDFSQYRALSLWICFPTKGAAYTLAFRCEGESKQQVNMFSNAYFKTMSAHKGWKRVEVAFNDFGTQGKANWAKVKDFRIEFNGAPNLTMYVDEISLVKK